MADRWRSHVRFLLQPSMSTILQYGWGVKICSSPVRAINKRCSLGLMTVTYFGGCLRSQLLLSVQHPENICANTNTTMKVRSSCVNPKHIMISRQYTRMHCSGVGKYSHHTWSKTPQEDLRGGMLLRLHTNRQTDAMLLIIWCIGSRKRRHCITLQITEISSLNFWPCKGPG